MEWKDIHFIDFNGNEHDYTGLYKISNDGQVYSCHRKRKIKGSKDKDGYVRVSLRKNGKNKTFPVHRLVAFMFIPKIDNKHNCVNHKDENKANNSFNNLEWCTTGYNNSYGTRQDRVHRKRRETMSTNKWKINNSGENSKASKKVVSINVDTFKIKEYVSLSQAEKENNMKPSAVTNAIKRKSITSNCLWFFKNDFEKYPQKDLIELIQIKKQRYKKFYKCKK